MITMKKARILNLIRYYTEKNDRAFRNESYEIAKEFDKLGDYALSEYILGLLSEMNVFMPQGTEDNEDFIKSVYIDNEPLYLPEKILFDFKGIINAIKNQSDVNKFLFQGKPGTGKTHAVKQLARILNRELYMVDFDSIIDSKLGQTSKNISYLFDEINNLPKPENVIILFDELDGVALDRTNSRDLREMGRATTSMLKWLDNLNSKIILIATTNLYDFFDKALLRRFDYCINFDRYSDSEILEVSNNFLDFFLKRYKGQEKNIKLFNKIIKLSKNKLYPGDLKNLIKTSIVFADKNNKYDYLKRIYISLNDEDLSSKTLKEKGFTLREIEIITGISKSSIGRELKYE